MFFKKKFKFISIEFINNTTATEQLNYEANNSNLKSLLRCRRSTAFLWATFLNYFSNVSRRNRGVVVSFDSTFLSLTTLKREPTLTVLTFLTGEEERCFRGSPRNDLKINVVKNVLFNVFKVALKDNLFSLLSWKLFRTKQRSIRRF